MKQTLLLKSGLISLMMLLFVVDISLAGNSASISVSCTIPAIPGINVPPFSEEKLEKQRTDKTVEEKIKNPEKEYNTASLLIIQEERKEIRLANEKTTSIAVTTIYVR